MRTLVALALIAVLGAGALGYAWHVLGKLPEREAAAPQTPDATREAPNAAPNGSAVRAAEPERVELSSAAEPAEDAPTARAPAGFEEGGLAPLVRDYAAIYAERTPDERRAALMRLQDEIAAARQALGQAELDELAGKSGNRPTTPGVARLLALIEERAWVQASLATLRDEDVR